MLLCLQLIFIPIRYSNKLCNYLYINIEIFNLCTSFNLVTILMFIVNSVHNFLLNRQPYQLLNGRSGVALTHK